MRLRSRPVSSPAPNRFRTEGLFLKASGVSGALGQAFVRWLASETYTRVFCEVPERLMDK
jgi:hypothetical protein